LSAGLTLGLAGVSRGQDKPPAEPPPPAGDQRPDRPGPGRDRQPPRVEPAQTLDRVHEAVKKLTLSDEQAAQIKGMVEQAKTAVAAALKDAEALEPRERFGKVREVMGPIREKMMDVLDETQREKLRENMQQAGGPGFG